MERRFPQMILEHGIHDPASLGTKLTWIIRVHLRFIRVHLRFQSLFRGSLPLQQFRASLTRQAKAAVSRV
jgi:hypothetical protein